MDLNELRKKGLDELRDLVDNDTSIFRWNRKDAFVAIAEKAQEVNQDDLVENCRREIKILDLSMPNKDNPYFHEKVTGTTEDGAPYIYPDFVNDFNTDDLEYFKKRACETKNPILLSRYFDFIWQKTKDVVWAKQAIHAYLDCCLIYETNQWHEILVSAIKRAITLACLINNKELIEICINQHYHYVDLCQRSGWFRPLKEIALSLISQKRIRQCLDYDKLEIPIENAIKYCKDNLDDSFLTQRFLIKALQEIGVSKKDGSNEILKVREAEMLEQEALYAQEHYPNGYSAASSIFTEALKIYMDIGKYPEKIEELKIRIRDSNDKAITTELHPVTGVVNIENKEIEAYLDMYRETNIDDVFRLIASDKNLIPSYDNCRVMAEENAKEFVLGFLASRKLYKGNLCIRTITETKEKFEFDTIRNFSTNYHLISNIALKRIFDIIKSKDSDYLKFLEKHLSSTGTISASRMAIIKYGLRAFSNGEYLVSIHILTLQVEGILRDMLNSIGVPTFSYRNNQMSEKTLGEIIKLLEKVDGIDTNLLKFIEIYLAEG